MQQVPAYPVQQQSQMQGIQQVPVYPAQQQPQMQPQMQLMVAAPGMFPPGAPPGGQRVHEKYMGTNSWIIAGVVCFFTCCGCVVMACPCDERDVYIAPNGQKYTTNGALL